MDGAVFALLNRLVNHERYPDAYRWVMDDLPAEDRAEVEASMERFAARKRAAGEIGW